MAEGSRTPVILYCSLRQWLAAAVLTVTGLGGCGGIHLSAPAITGSAAPTGTLGYAGSDRTDWDVIRETVATTPVTTGDARIAWQNKATGSSGTITNVATNPNLRGTTCRSFASTIAAVDGVRLFNAEICRSVMNTWEFAKIQSADDQGTGL